MSMIQKQVISKAIKDPLFAKDIFTELPVSSFDEAEEYKEICSVISRYYQTNSKPLDENTLVTLVEDRLLRRNASPDKLASYLRVTNDLYRVVEVEQNEEIIDQQIQKYVRSTLSANLIRNTLAKESLDDEGVIEKLSEELKKISIMSTSDVSSKLFDFFEDTDRKLELYNNMQQSRFSTGFPSIDAVADGGLARGEMGLVIATTGGGKSTWITQQTNNYVKKGMNVLYVALEEKLDRMVLKLEQNLLGMKKSELLNYDGTVKKDVFHAIQAGYKTYPTLGNLYVSKHNPQEVSITMLEQIIVDATIRKGVQLDAVIIDYPDLMRNHHLKYSSESDAGGKLYEDIRGLAGRYGYVCWVVSQLNRTAYSQEVRTAESIEGSKRKLNAVEIAFTLNQKKEEKQEGFLRIHLDKIRYAGDSNYDTIQYFRVSPDGYTIRDATPDEIVYGKSLVNSSAPAPEKKNGYQSAKDNVDRINNAI